MMTKPSPFSASNFTKSEPTVPDHDPLESLDLEELLATARSNLAAKPPELKEVEESAYEAQLRIWRMRRKWTATMWLLGASHRQLAAATGVRHETVNQSMNKILPPFERRQQRLASILTHTGLSWYTEKFFAHKEAQQAEKPLDAAKWLLANEPYTGD